MARTAVVLAVLLTTTFLAGCFGGDEDPTTGTDDPQDTMEEGTGSVEGRVLTEDLDEVVGANVVLVQDADLVEETTTNEQGSYQISNIEPGAYRLQISAACCHQSARAVQVVEGETTQVDVQLSPFTSDDLKEYRVEHYEWTGFLSCAVVVVIYATDPCGNVDEAADRAHPFELGVGAETVTAALIWDSPGLLGEELQYGFATDPCGCSVPGDYYDFTVGTSPLVLRSDGGGNSLSFGEHEEPLEVQMRVFPPFSSDLDMFYQMEFTVHYQLHYHQPAPEDFDPVPDM